MSLRHNIIMASCLTLFLSCQKMEIPDNTPAVKNDRVDVAQVNDKTNAMSHVILLVDTVSEDKAEVMYISLQEWSDITSNFSAGQGTEMHRIASEYREGDFTGWHIPTLAEVKRIKAYYDEESGRLDILNDNFEMRGATPVYLTDATAKTYRYLCSNGDSTFSFRKGYATLKAGATVKYNLRLVKDSVMTLVPNEIEFAY